ncbi:MAG: hypothetical protein ACKOSS_06850, partial [Planctomycetia bacterium]
MSGAWRWLACLLLLALAGCRAPRVGPAPDEALNPWVLAVLRSYPTDGTHRYHWPKDEPGRPAPWRGNARTLYLEGEVLSAGDPEGRCHCSGLTFEVFVQAWQAREREAGRPARVGRLDLAGLRHLQQQWFGSPEDLSTLRTALVENGLGVEVHDLEQARPGDFVQLWRHGGSGHAAIFLAWERAADGSRAGLRYWSTQRSTDGIGERVERFGPGPGELRR